MFLGKFDAINIDFYIINIYYLLYLIFVFILLLFNINIYIFNNGLINFRNESSDASVQTITVFTSAGCSQHRMHDL